jgi:tetratricopeptide (TPR) repeat protein
MREPGRRGAILLLVALAAAVYSNSFGADYTLDSRIVLAEDPRLDAFSARNLRDVFAHGYWWPRWESDLYRPVTTLSWLIGFRLAGGDRGLVWPLHAVNLALHALNALLVLSIGRRLFGSLAPALFLAAVFTVHPLATEDVTNLVGRADLLATLFVLLGLRLHIALRDGTPRRGLALATLGACALLGVFSKESAVVLVGLVALYDLCFPAAAAGDRAPRLVDGSALLRTLRGGAWRSYAAIAPSLVLLALARFALLHESPVFAQKGCDNPIAAAGWLAGRITALGVIGDYLRLALWPSALSCDYSHARIPVFGGSLADPRDRTALAATAVLVLLAWAVLRAGRSRRDLLFFAGLFAVALLPVSNLLFPIGTILGERFMYLPTVGVFGALLAGAALPLLSRAHRRWPERRRAIRAAARVAAAALVAAFAARAFVRNFDWRDEVTLWTAASRVAPESYKVWNGLANALVARGAEPADLERALSLLRRAQAVLESHPLPPVHLPGKLYDDTARLALQLGDAASRADGVTPPARSPKAEAYYREAHAASLRAVEIDAAVGAASREARVARGIRPERIALAGDFQVHLTRGHVALRLGRSDEAREAFLQARRLEPTRPETHETAAKLELWLGQPRRAAVLYLQALAFGAEREELWDAIGELYHGLDPSVPAWKRVDGASVLNLDHALLRADLRSAMVELVGLLAQSGRRADAALVARAAAERYGVEPAAFDPVLGARR